LLKDSLGGNCRTVMIANVGPTSLSYEDTYNTLKYATRANKIQQRMKKNIINCDNHVAQYIKQAEELMERVTMLEAELAKAKEKESICIISTTNENGLFN
jgi:kinesin family member 18/19